MESIPKKNIRKDYLEHAEPLRPFYQYTPYNFDVSEIIKDKASQKLDREALHAVLKRQHKSLPTTEKTQKNIDAILAPTTFTFTTGHQLVLWGGPLYTIYKIMTVIKLAEHHQKLHPAYHFVPIFWVHTEDHDFEEINHYYRAFGKKISYDVSHAGKVGTHILQEEILATLPRLPEAYTRAYTPGKSMKTAFMEFMYGLFADYGLVLLDPDEPELKQQFTSVIEGELNQQTSFSVISASSGEMEASGYPLQIHPREINLFYMVDEVRGRIMSQNGHFTVHDSSFTFSPEELLSQIQTHPEYFSPNVSLRPLYQEIILPNLAYIGGWGELSYWLQLKGIFDHYGINFPLLLPRFSALIYRKEQLAAWEKLGLGPEEIEKDLHQLYKDYMPNIWQDTEYLRLGENLSQSVEALEIYIRQYSETLPRSVIGQRVKNERFLKNLKRKLHRVIRHNQPSTFNEIEALKLALQPDRKVQERVLSLDSFSDVDPKAFIKWIWSECDPLSLRKQYLCLPEELTVKNPS
ncbi:MAG: bacillithiol biosynthesis cysteine-adding enzyme BshC [Bacteroidota bacterium]